MLDATGRNSLPVILGHIPAMALAYSVLPLAQAHSIAVWLVLFVLGVTGALLIQYVARRLGRGFIQIHAITTETSARPAR